MLDAPTLAAVAALGLVAAIVGGIGGFGTGIILAAALVPLLGFKAVVPVLAVAGAIINSGRFWFYRSSLDRRTLGIVLAAALPFLVLGTWIYSELDARSTGTVLGLTVIASVPVRRFLQRRKIVLGPAGLAGAAPAPPSAAVGAMALPAPPAVAVAGAADVAGFAEGAAPASLLAAAAVAPASAPFAPPTASASTDAAVMKAERRTARPLVA